MTSVARGWQQPDELPIAPRVIDVEELPPSPQREGEAPQREGEAPAEPGAVLDDEAQSGNAEHSPAVPLEIAPQQNSNSSRRPRSEPGQPSDTAVEETSGPVQLELADEQPPLASLPIHLPKAPGVPLNPAMFQGVQPGRTTLEELTTLWGQPLETGETGERLRFQVEPFEQVDAIIRGGLVASLIIHLPQPTQPTKVIEQLSLAKLTCLELGGPAGKTIAHGYPERGITLGLDLESELPLVVRVVLEPISGEPFLMRVKSDRNHQWQQNLNDLQTAIWLNPQDDRAWWLQSELLSLQGQQRPAAASVTQALRLAPRSHLYMLTGARILSDVGEIEMPVSTAADILELPNVDPLLRSRAAGLLGDLTAGSPPFDYQKALDYHQQSIKLAVPMATSDRIDVRRAAKRLLFDAHLAVANDLARGRWKKKEVVVPQWLSRAEAIVEELLANDQGDPALLFEMNCRQLDALSWLDGKVDAAEAVQQTQAQAQKITQEATDELYRNHITWQLGKALVDAVDVHRARNEADQALQIGTIAEATLTPLAEAGWRGEETQYQLSRLYFLLGSVHAVQRKDHTAALKWFDKAADVLARPEPDIDLRRTARRGEWLVSMGVTYWQQNDKLRGLKLTELGAALVEGSHREQAVAQEKLAVPYGNLAFMYEDLGHEEKAKQYSELAAKVTPAKQR
jgi:tetratricopeptide (TPR) repeat protein